MRYISMFSGIEAASVAFSPLGWDPICFAEIEAFPAAVLNHHYPGVPNVGDMTAHDWSQYRGHCDLVVGGPPCQAFSVAGLRLSLDDHRGNLSLQYMKAIHAIDPIWSITENVPGWLSTKDNAFGCFLAGLVGEDAELLPPGGRWTDAGVASGPERTAAWRCLDAQYFGLAQRRKRVFVLSVRGSGNWRCAEALFPLTESVPRNPPPRREAGKGIAPILEAGARTGKSTSDPRAGSGIGEAGDPMFTLQAGKQHAIAPTLPSRSKGGGGLGTDFDCDGGLIAPEVSLCLNAGGMGRQDSESESETLIAHSLRADGFDASEDGTGRGTPIVACIPVAIEVCPTLRAGGNSTGGARPPGTDADTSDSLIVMAIAFSAKDHGADAGEISPTLRSGGHDKSHANGGVMPAVVVPIDMRQASRGEKMTNNRAEGSSGGAPGTGIGKDGDPAPTVASSHVPAVAFDLRGREGGAQFEGPHDTANVRAASGGSSRSYVAASAVRRLTPRECERLQGFKDDYTLVTYRGKPAADGPRYKALGNSMAVPCMFWIGQRIQMAEAA